MSKHLLTVATLALLAGCGEYVTLTIPPPGHPVDDGGTCGDAVGALCCGDMSCAAGLYCYDTRGGAPKRCQGDDGGQP